MMSTSLSRSQRVAASGTGPAFRRALVAGVTVLVAFPALAGARGSGQREPPGEVRATDLALLENALETVISTAIEARIRAINEEQAQAPTEPERGAVVAAYQFRTSGQTHARGMFLEGYGVIFQVQVPTLGANTYVWSLGNQPGAIAYVSPEAEPALPALANEIRIRTQLSLLEEELGEVSRQLVTAAERQGETEHVRLLQETASSLRALYEQFRRQAEMQLREGAEAQRQARAAGEEAQRQARAAREMDREVRQRQAAAEARTVTVPRRRNMGLDVLDVGRARERAEAHKTEIEAAVIEAVIDTLAQYGRIVHGLGPDDRLAVVLLPSSYTMARWLRATERPEEFIISVRYGDVMAFDRREIDEAELGQRIRVESRLGQPRDAIRPPEQRD